MKNNKKRSKAILYICHIAFCVCLRFWIISHTILLFIIIHSQIMFYSHQHLSVIFLLINYACLCTYGKSKSAVSICRKYTTTTKIMLNQFCYFFLVIRNHASNKMCFWKINMNINKAINAINYIICIILEMVMKVFKA